MHCPTLCPALALCARTPTKAKYKPVVCVYAAQCLIRAKFCSDSSILLDLHVYYVWAPMTVCMFTLWVWEVSNRQWYGKAGQVEKRARPCAEMPEQCSLHWPCEYVHLPKTVQACCVCICSTVSDKSQILF